MIPPLILAVVGCAAPRPPPVTTPRPVASHEAPRAGAALKPGWRHFIEPDALAFVWGSAAVGATTYAVNTPGNNPLWFPTSEGGGGVRGNAIPNWQIAVGTSMLPVLIASDDDESRWHHTKGALQALLTTAAVTEVAKNVFGRHRPFWRDGMTTSADASKSFFSGHSSLTAAATTYAGLYLHTHVFSRWRGAARFAWWEIPSYVALAALAIYVPYTRIEDNMHHPSDVIVGSVVGTTMSAVFFGTQERRYRRARRLRDSFRESTRD